MSGKCMSTQNVYVCPGTHHPALYSDSLETSAADFNWIGEPPTAVSDAMQVRGAEGLHRAWDGKSVVCGCDGRALYIA